jgi:predicted peroxiredoxin
MLTFWWTVTIYGLAIYASQDNNKACFFFLSFGTTAIEKENGKKSQHREQQQLQ